MVWVVMIRQNLTACDVIHRGPHTQRTLSEHVFESEPEAMKFYEEQKNFCRLTGSGMYATYPTTHESFTVHTHTCDYCGERFSLEKDGDGHEDLGFTDLPNGDFCSRGCFRNSFQSSREADYDEPYYEDEY